MRDSERLVIVGGGQAAAQTIESARKFGFKGPITLLSDEPLLPYIRPPLSKQFLTGRFADEWLLYRPKNFYLSHGVDVRLNQRVIKIDAAAAKVETTDGTMSYDRLVLATGARARRLGVSGDDFEQIVYLRTAEDARSLIQKLNGSKEVVIVGAGFIGLEVAAVLTQAGTFSVKILASGDRLCSKLDNPSPRWRHLFPTLLHNLFSRQGVEIHFKVDVCRFERRASGQITIVTTTNTCFTADLVVVGIGAIPNIELGQACGLACDNGIIVDENALTSNSKILAAGDCASHPNSSRTDLIRLETVHNAVEQARTVGATIAGKMLPYDQTPWVWSDMFGHRIQSVGFSDRADNTILRGDAGTTRFGLLHFEGARLVGGDFIDSPDWFGACRRIINQGADLSHGNAQDMSFDLHSVVPRTTRLSFDEPWKGRPKNC